MDIKVWNAELPPFPREGLNHLEPADDCPVIMNLKLEAAKLARIHQLEPPRDRAELRRMQKRLRAKIWEKLGTVYDPTVPLDVREYGVVKYDGFVIRKLTYQSRPGIHVTALLYVPDGPGPFPCVIHMHGHVMEGKLGVRIQETSLSLVKHGMWCWRSTHSACTSGPANVVSGNITAVSSAARFSTPARP